MSAKPDGTLSLETNNAGARSRMEIRGGPAILVRDASGAEAGLVFVLPRDGTSPPDPAPLLPGWIAATLATALVALRPRVRRVAPRSFALSAN